MAAKLLIMDSDRKYAERLFLTLANRFPDVFDITVLPDSVDFEQFLNENVFDITLLNPSIYVHSFDLKKAGLVIRLVDIDSPDEADPGLSQYTAIHKYQRVSDISRAVIAIYSEQQYSAKSDGEKHTLMHFPPITRKKKKHSKDIEIFTVFQASGGCGATTAAMAMALKASGCGKRVLYLNFEHHCSTHLMFGDGGGEPGMTEILESLRRGVHIGYKLDTLVKRDPFTEVMYFPRFRSADDLSLVTENDMRSLINGIIETDRYDVLIIDAGVIFSDWAAALLDRSHDVLITVSSSDIGVYKACQILKSSSLIKSFENEIGIILNYLPEMGSWELLEASNLQLEIAAYIPRLPDGTFRSVVEEINRRGCLDELLSLNVWS